MGSGGGPLCLSMIPSALFSNSTLHIFHAVACFLNFWKSTATLPEAHGENWCTHARSPGENEMLLPQSGGDGVVFQRLGYDPTNLFQLLFLYHREFNIKTWKPNETGFFMFSPKFFEND